MSKEHDEAEVKELQQQVATLTAQLDGEATRLAQCRERVELLEKQCHENRKRTHSGDCHWWGYKVCDCGYLMRANSHDFGEPSDEIIQAWLEHSERIQKCGHTEGEK
jgi:hypothetical protein